MPEHARDTHRLPTTDQRLDLKEGSGISIVRMVDGGTGLDRLFEPDGTWDADETRPPGSPDNFPMLHIGYCLSGQIVMRRHDTGAETRIGKGDFFEIPPGYHVVADGEERVKLILFASPEDQHGSTLAPVTSDKLKSAGLAR